MIEPDPEMFLFSTFTDDELRAIEDIYGPEVKAAFLTPWPVPLEDVRHDHRMAAGTEG
jgi:hypothetical protein